MPENICCFVASAVKLNTAFSDLLVYVAHIVSQNGSSSSSSFQLWASSSVDWRSSFAEAKGTEFDVVLRSFLHIYFGGLVLSLSPSFFDGQTGSQARCLSVF